MLQVELKSSILFSVAQYGVVFDASKNMEYLLNYLIKRRNQQGQKIYLFKYKIITFLFLISKVPKCSSCTKTNTEMRKPAKNKSIRKKNRFISLCSSSKKQRIINFLPSPPSSLLSRQIFIANVDLHLPINKKFVCIHKLFSLLRIAH